MKNRLPAKNKLGSKSFRAVFLLLVLASSFARVGGEVTPRNILASRFTFENVRRELIPRNRWKLYPQTAKEWKSRVPAKTLDEIVKKGEQILTRPIPILPASIFLEYVRTGNRSNYEAVSFARRNHLMELVLAESVEDRGRFTDAIADYVWAICEETYWGIPAHVGVQKAKSGLPDANDPTVDLFGAETVAALALADYLVGAKLDKVSPLIRPRIYSESARRIFEPIKQTNRYNWLDPQKNVNNWNPWILSNVMAANLLLESDEAKRAENLYSYLRLLDIYLNGLGADGGCDEGPSYWFAAGGSVFDALEILQSATENRLNIYDEPLIQKMASYIYKTHIDDNYFVNFADADPKFSGDGLMIYRFGKNIKDETLADFGLYLYGKNGRIAGEGFQRPRRLNNLLTVKNLPAGENKFTPPAESWFSDIEVLTARTKSGLFLATHAGHNGESHNHNDVGDFIVYFGGEPVIIDAGRGNYTAKTFSAKRYELWFTQSQFHNLPVINSFGQSAGKNYTAQGVKRSSAAAESALSMNLAPAYPKEAGVEFWNRAVKLNRAADTVEITDDYSLTKPANSLQQIFMTICDIDLKKAGKIKLTTTRGKIVFLNYEAAEWTIAVEKPATEGAEYSSFKSKWDDREIKRIILTAKNPKSKNLLQYKIIPAR